MEARLRPLLRVIGYYGAESTRARQAEALFRSCAVQASHPTWTRHGRVEDDFRPRHALIMAHVWMVHRRLHDANSKLLQEAVFDELWEDTTRRVRGTGVPELMVNKHLTDVQKYSFAAAIEYDTALQADDKTDHLAAAVWRHVFLAKEDDKITVEHCNDVATYMLAQLDMLSTLTLADVTDAKLDWKPPRFAT